MMIIYKIAGSLVLVVCGWICGITLAERGESALALTEGYISLVKHIRNQIDCFNLPLGRILSACPRDILASCGVLEGEDVINLPALIESMQGRVPQQVFVLLAKFAGELGTGYRDTQLKLCDYYAGKLLTERDRLAADLPRQRKMLMTLCLCASAGAAIILL